MLTLLEKIYGTKTEDKWRAFNNKLALITEGLDAEVKLIGYNARNWIQVEVLGSDSKVIANYMRKKFGLGSSFTDIQLPMVLKGKIIDSGKFGYGIYVDVGIASTSPQDALIPLHRIRSNLADGKKVSLRKITNFFCLYNNFPISIRLTKLDVERKKIWAELSDCQIKIFRNWLSTYLERIIILGAYHKQVIDAIKISGVRQDIVKVDELGFLEHSLLCKLGTNTSGVIKALSRYLRNSPLYAFSPKRIKNLREIEGLN